MIKVIVLEETMYVFYDNEDRARANEIWEIMSRCRKEGRTDEKVMMYNLSEVSWARKLLSEVERACSGNPKCYELLPEHVVC